MKRLIDLDKLENNMEYAQLCKSDRDLIRSYTEASTVKPVDVGMADQPFAMGLTPARYREAQEFVEYAYHLGQASRDEAHRVEMEAIRLKVLCFDCANGIPESKQCYSVGWEKCKGKHYRQKGE